MPGFWHFQPRVPSKYLVPSLSTSCCLCASSNSTNSIRQKSCGRYTRHNWPKISPTGFKGREFVRLTTSEFVLIQWASAQQRCSGPKHMVAHEHGGQMVERCCKQGERPCSHKISSSRELSSSAQFLFPQVEGECVC